MSQKSLEEYFEAKNVLHLLEIFKEKGIDEPNLLCRLKYSDLIKVGLETFSDRRMVFDIINQINEENISLNSNQDKAVSDYNEVSFNNIEKPEVPKTKNIQAEMKCRPRRKSETENRRITVCVRKKPVENGELDIVDVQERYVIVNEHKVKLDLEKYIERHSFIFDFAFNEFSKNEEVFQNGVAGVVEHFMGGGNGSVIAYGQTGTGKTHTMFHPQSGMVYLAISKFLEAKKKGKIAFYEIYMNGIYDLLNFRERISMRESNGNVFLVNIKERNFENLEQATAIIDEGLNYRRTGVTGANSESSRSHAIMRLIEVDESFKSRSCIATPKKGCKNVTEVTFQNNLEVSNSLIFVDLAGSERGSDRQFVNTNVKNEGAEINKSLLALKECIRGMDMDAKYLPFRQSKLTQVLKNSFVGSSKTCVIATVTPSRNNSEHTLNTLRYAFRIKEYKDECFDSEIQSSFCETSYFNKKNVMKDKEISNDSINDSFNRSFSSRRGYAGVLDNSKKIYTNNNSFNSSLSDDSNSPKEYDNNVIKKRILSAFERLKEEVDCCNNSSVLENVSKSVLSIEKYINEMKF